jgi:hypothetical protein
MRMPHLCSLCFDSCVTFARTHAQDVIVRTYGARRSPFDLLAPSAVLRAAAALADERLAFGAVAAPRPRL